jgi:hypothetical protein
MDNTSMAKYAALMKEVKLRTEVIQSFQAGRSGALYVPPTIESICLQIRKILELIAFGSLIANKPAYAKAYSDFAKTWNAELLLRDLSRINANFYPRAIFEVPSAIPGVVNDFKDREDALTEADFVKIYKKCGAIMHASNPYGSIVDIDYYKSQVSDWVNKIVNLLDSHVIRLLDESRFYLVHMKEDKDDEVHWYEFSRMEGEGPGNGSSRLSST